MAEACYVGEVRRCAKMQELREFGINYTFLTCTTHSFVAFVRHHRIDYLYVTDAESVSA